MRSVKINGAKYSFMTCKLKKTALLWKTIISI